MRRLVVLAAGLTATLAPAGGTGAQAPGANDTDGDGSPSGREYAQFHVTALAPASMLETEGTRPGEHHRFSGCR